MADCLSAMVLSAGNQRRHVFYRGRVQGVGFRFTAQRTARRYAVGGFVRNLRDGRVELVVEGTAEEVGRFLNEIAERMADYIDVADVEIAPATGEFTGFDVRF